MIKGFGLVCMMLVLGFSSSRMSTVTVNHVRDGGCPHDSLEYDSLSGLYVHIFCEIMPEPVGGLKLFHKYIRQNLVAPKYQTDIITRAVVSFVINKKGQLVAARIRGKESYEYTSFDSAVIKAIPDTLRWVPGMCGGEPVNVKRFAPVEAHYKSRR